MAKEKDLEVAKPPIAPEVADVVGGDDNNIEDDKLFSRLYEKNYKELILQHFLLIAVAGSEISEERKAQNVSEKLNSDALADAMLTRYTHWINDINIVFPDVQVPKDVPPAWWRMMLLALERKPVTGRSLWRKFRDDTRTVILRSYNKHWLQTNAHLSLEERVLAVKMGVWVDQGYNKEDFTPDWLPKQWYAWRYCSYPGKATNTLIGVSDKPLAPSSKSKRKQVEPSTNSGESTPGDGIEHAAKKLSTKSAGDGTQKTPKSSEKSTRYSAANCSDRLMSAVSSAATTIRRTSNASALSPSRSLKDNSTNVKSQQYSTELHFYDTQMTRLERAVELAIELGEDEKQIALLKRQLYEHVSKEPPRQVEDTVEIADVGGRTEQTEATESADHSVVVPPSNSCAVNVTAADADAMEDVVVGSAAVAAVDANDSFEGGGATSDSEDDVEVVGRVLVP